MPTEFVILLLLHLFIAQIMAVHQAGRMHADRRYIAMVGFLSLTISFAVSQYRLWFLLVQ